MRIADVSFKKIKLATAVAVIIVLTGLSILVLPDQVSADSQEIEPVFFDLPPEHMVLTSVAAFNSPNPEYGIHAWQDQVCAGMTTQGCDAFNTLYASATWEAVSGIPVGATFVQLVEEVDSQKDGHHFWKLEVQAWVGQEGDYTEHAFDVYVDVVQNEDSGLWLLDRILLDEDAKSRYASG